MKSDFKMKKKLLLICPHFMGYDKKIIEYANSKYDITYLNSEDYLSKIRLKYQQNLIFVKLLLKIIKPLRTIYREKLLKENEKKLNSYFKAHPNNNLVLIINGDSITDVSYNVLKKYNKDAKFVLYIWDDINCLFKKTHFIFFDKIYSYNIADCKNFNFTYLPMFTDSLLKNNNMLNKYDIAIIATANERRVKIARKIYERYKSEFSFYIYFYSPHLQYDFFSHEVPLDYQEYLNVLYESKAILEMPRHDQKGPTTRFFDSIETKTKVITTNKEIMKYPIYGENIFILDRKMNIPSKFIKEPFVEENKSVMYIDGWFQTLER